MKHIQTILFLSFFFVGFSLKAQHVGILRKNYFSSYFDTVLNMQIDVFDSATIRIGSINTGTGAVTPIGANAYNMAINLTGATINPYTNHYHIGSGQNFATFDLSNGNLVSNVPISGPLTSWAFQNFRFNPSDTVIYGLVPQNFYSSYFDSLSMSTIQVLDSSHIRFAAINPQTGVYSLIGNTPYRNVYTLAGNAINPHQMLFHYSAVDTLVSVDLYTGNVYSEVPIQVPANAIFENFTYSCADSAIYGLVRQSYYSSVYDSILMQFIDVMDSITYKLGRINPNTGQVIILSANNLALGATLNGGCFIDPDSMTYYFSNGANIIGVSLLSGQVTSNMPMAFPGANMYFDMMRSTKNCFGAQKIRVKQTTSTNDIDLNAKLALVPNPTQGMVTIQSELALKSAEVLTLSGTRLFTTTSNRIDVSSLAAGMYWVKVQMQDGRVQVLRLAKVD